MGAESSKEEDFDEYERPRRNQNSRRQNQQQQQRYQQRQPQPQPQPQPKPRTSPQPDYNGQPDYSAQWVEYYRSIGKLKEAELVEQAKAAAASKAAEAAAQPDLGVPELQPRMRQPYGSQGTSSQHQGNDSQHMTSNSCKQQPSQDGQATMDSVNAKAEAEAEWSRSGYQAGARRGGGHRGRGHRGGGNRGRNRKDANVHETSNLPPKYEDVVRQTYKKENPASDGMNKGITSSKPPAEGSLGDRGPRNINALNDLIRKEFGSVGGPIHTLPNVDTSEKLFAGRNRLFVGNLPPGVQREDVNELMGPFGDIVIDFYNNEKNFGFVRLKHREQAENAQRSLDGYVFRGRTLRVRFANRNPCFKVRNLSPLVTNELLKKAFSSFGEVERAEIIVESGKPTGEGFLEFADKKAGEMALEACVDGCFVLTKSLRPIILEEVDPDNGQRGFIEKQLQRNDADFKKEREVGPRFLAEGSSEYACGLLWKSLFERRRCEEEALAMKYRLEEENLLKSVEALTNNVGNMNLNTNPFL